MIEIETKYNKGDVVTINKKNWIVEDITMKFGRVWVYGLHREKKNGKAEHCSIETSSLETMMGDITDG